MNTVRPQINNFSAIWAIVKESGYIFCLNRTKFREENSPLARQFDTVAFGPYTFGVQKNFSNFFCGKKMLNDLVKSKRFWAAVAGIAVVVMKDRLPVALDEQQITMIVMAIGSWIVGDSLRATTVK